MIENRKKTAEEIFLCAVDKANPYTSVFNDISSRHFNNPAVVAAGKAAAPMAAGAFDALGKQARSVTVLTKYGHTPDDIPEGFITFEAGHPVPDENGLYASKYIIDKCRTLKDGDELIFLLSGGASALFEYPEVSLNELKDITNELLKSSADITEINTIRKRLSKVKGGKFARDCKAKIYCVILSDVISNDISSVASGPCCADFTTCDQAEAIINKYNIHLSETAKKFIKTETPKKINNVTVSVVGDISILCKSAMEKAESLGFDAKIVTDSMTGEARDRAKEVCLYAVDLQKKITVPTALIYGGETTVTVRGSGKGGRNQEMALTAAKFLDKTKGITFLSAGSDGTDGPTNAAGGIADGSTAEIMKKNGVDIDLALKDNASYNALKSSNSLLITGATGTNVNDLTLVLIDINNT